LILAIGTINFFRNMSKIIRPTEKWGTLEELEIRYKKEKDKVIALKLNAIKLLMKGKPQCEITEILKVGTKSKN
jgi:hypothetical protein